MAGQPEPEVLKGQEEHTEIKTGQDERSTSKTAKLQEALENALVATGLESLLISGQNEEGPDESPQETINQKSLKDQQFQPIETVC